MQDNLIPDSPQSSHVVIAIDYFRLPRHHWAAALIRARQSGATWIGVRACWGWHEIAENRFDLSGETNLRRNLVDFVRLCQSLNLAVLLQPGPILHAGVLGFGAPVWLLTRHPELLALGADSVPWQDPDAGQKFPSLPHPAFQEHVQRWYHELTHTLLPLQSPNGPIAALHLDPGWPPPTGQDHNPYVADTLWPLWRRKQGGSPPATLVSAAPADRTAFYQWTADLTLTAWRKQLAEAGWTVPIYSPPNDPIASANCIHPWIPSDPDPPDIGAAVQYGPGQIAVEPLKLDSPTDRQTILRDAASLAARLYADLENIELRARAEPADATLSPARSALDQAARAIDRAARYADQLRGRIESLPPASLSSVRMSPAALNHLIATRQAAHTAQTQLEQLAADISADSSPHPILAGLTPQPGWLLGQLRSDIQAGEIEHNFAQKIENLLYHLTRMVFLVQGDRPV